MESRLEAVWQYRNIFEHHHLSGVSSILGSRAQDSYRFHFNRYRYLFTGVQ